MKKQFTLVTTPKPVALAAYPRCHRRVRLTTQGLLWAHRTIRWNDRYDLSVSCPGRYRKPAQGTFGKSRWARGLRGVAPPRPTFPRIFPAGLVADRERA